MRSMLVKSTIKSPDEYAELLLLSLLLLFKVYNKYQCQSIWVDLVASKTGMFNVWNMFKVKSKDTRMTSMTLF